MFNLLIAMALGFAQPTMQPTELPQTHFAMPVVAAESTYTTANVTKARKTVIIIIRCRGKNCTIIIIQSAAARASMNLQAGDKMVEGECMFDANTQENIFTPTDGTVLPNSLSFDPNIKVASELRGQVNTARQLTIKKAIIR